MRVLPVMGFLPLLMPLRPLMRTIAPRAALADEGLSRAERRAAWWSSSPRHPANRPRGPAAEEEASSLAQGPHPLHAHLRRAELEADRLAVAGASLNAGERVMIQVVEESPLGLGVRVLPTGEGGLVYNDEAGFVPDGSSEPIAIGDVVPAWVHKVRSDARLDLTFRPPGARAKTDDATAALLGALLEARDGGGDGHIMLGDASSPAAIKVALGLSKSQFKAARGALFKVGVLDRDSDPAAWPTETRLRQQLSWPVSGLADSLNDMLAEDMSRRHAARGAATDHAATTATTATAAAATATAAAAAAAAPPLEQFELSELPPMCGDAVIGPVALLALLAPYGEVRSLRGLLDNRGEFTHCVQVQMEEGGAASVALAALARFNDADGPRAMSIAPRAPRTASARGGAADADASAGPPGSRTCFVGNLPDDAVADDLWDTYAHAHAPQSVAHAARRSLSPRSARGLERCGLRRPAVAAASPPSPYARRSSSRLAWACAQVSRVRLHHRCAHGNRRERRRPTRVWARDVRRRGGGEQRAAPPGDGGARQCDTRRAGACQHHARGRGGGGLLWRGARL